MPIEVACQCGARFAARDELVGQTRTCPRCGQTLAIPRPPPPVPVAVPPSDVSLDLQRRRQALQDQYLANKSSASAAPMPVEEAPLDGPVRIQSLGGMTEGTTAVIMRPWPAFSNLSPDGGTVEAFEFAFMGAFLMGLFWLCIYTLFFFTLPLIALAQDPAAGASFSDFFTNVLLPAYAKGVMAFAAFYAISMVVTFGIQGPIMAAVAHVILTNMGHSDRSYLATLRVYTYCIGANLVLALIPPFTFITPITGVLSLVLAFMAHHRVSAGVALLATVLGSLVAFGFSLMLNLAAGAALRFAFLLMNPPTAF